MTRAELELQCIRTSIEAYNHALKYNENLSDEDKVKIRKKIEGLNCIRDEILSQTNNYGL